MEETKICPDCGRPLTPVTFYMHPEDMADFEWLLENRKRIAGEQTIDAVLYRLIGLEVNKRKGIEASKARNKRG